MVYKVEEEVQVRLDAIRKPLEDELDAGFVPVAKGAAFLSVGAGDMDHIPVALSLETKGN